MNETTRVEWREWGGEVFDEAAEADVPILLSLTATWCDHCHEMDAETYAEPRIAANVNDSFVPVRVDVDRHPRVRDRYNMGGFPSTVFLAPNGKVLTGAGYLGPDGMRQVLDSVRTMWQTKGTGAARVPRPLREDNPPAGELTADIEQGMLGHLTDTYDETAGGWGQQPKFPLPDALEFALKRDREMALRSYDAVGANLLDEYEGGFYRFATEPDWSGLQREKLLDSNGALVRAFANAYLLTGADEYRDPAERTIEYLTGTLWNGEVAAFSNSQAPGEDDAYSLDATDRAAAAEPPVDEGSSPDPTRWRSRDCSPTTPTPTTSAPAGTPNARSRPSARTCSPTVSSRTRSRTPIATATETPSPSQQSGARPRRADDGREHDRSVRPRGRDGDRRRDDRSPSRRGLVPRRSRRGCRPVRSAAPAAGLQRGVRGRAARAGRPDRRGSLSRGRTRDA